MDLQRTYFSCPTSSIQEFKEFAEKAKEHGATHIFVSDLPKSIWQWNLDRKDPYSQWGMESSAIFKVFVPEPFKKFLPVDYASNNMEILKRRGEVLNKLGLKAAFHGCEPGWLPEEVFRAYPMWRGPRCDHPRRARKPYFSLCIDHPEVLELYREAVYEICKNVPIEHFNFKTNDAGGGMCWTKHLYPGINGPEHCKHRPIADRVTGFLKAIQDGAEKAGLNSTASFSTGFLKDEIYSIIPNLKPGQYINGRARDGRVIEANIGFFSHYFSSCTYPVLGIPQLLKFTEELEKAYQEQIPLRKISVQPDNMEYFETIKVSGEKAINGVVDRYNLLMKVASNLVGDNLAGLLVDCWDLIEKGVETTRPINSGGNIILLGCVSQRWINRPFVVFPMELKPEEKDYYREFQFQSNTEEEACDLLNCQGNEFVNGYSGVKLATKLLEKSIDYFRKAINKLDKLIEEIRDNDYSQHLETLKIRIQAMIHIYKTAVHAARFQEILDSTFGEEIPLDSTRVWTDIGDVRIKELQNITRAEIDNVLELANLLENSKVPVLELAKSEEEEYTFLLGPNIVEQLRMKASIMQDHWLDSNRLYTLGSVK